MLDLQCKNFFVTGASSGIGRAAAVLLSRLGASVIICGRDEKRLKETFEMMDGDSHGVIAFEMKDFSSYGDVFEKAIAINGRKLDGLVHCAGVAVPTPTRVMNEEVIHEILDVNYVSFMLLVRQYSKKKYNRGGSIVAVSAVNAHYPQKCMSVYAGSKLALEASVKALALELVDQAIRINCVVPGGVNTPMAQQGFEETKEYLGQKALLGMAEPEDVANMIAFLLSDMSRKITGRAMYVDCGWLGQ